MCVALLEVKLDSEVSTGATPDGAVSHQLAKYWVHLTEQCLAEGSVPLGVVFITEGISIPQEEFTAANEELFAKGYGEGEFSWLSWRRFEHVVKHEGPAVLRDLRALLREHWRLAWVEDRWVWPAPALHQQTPPFFRESWFWPAAPTRTRDPEWFHG